MIDLLHPGGYPDIFPDFLQLLCHRISRDDGPGGFAVVKTRSLVRVNSQVPNIFN
jgi:hypothetical protein